MTLFVCHKCGSNWCTLLGIAHSCKRGRSILPYSHKTSETASPTVYFIPFSHCEGPGHQDSDFKHGKLPGKGREGLLSPVQICLDILCALDFGDFGRHQASFCLTSYLSEMGHVPICPDQCTYDTNNAHVQCQFVRI